MLKFKISERSGRIPAALVVMEFTVFFAAVLTTVYLGPFADGAAAVSLSEWALRALVFALAVMIFMALFKLYQGRPQERIGIAMLRLAASFATAGTALQFIYITLPSVRLPEAALVAALVVSFFFLGTMRPVFLDSIAERRSRRRRRRTDLSATAQTDSKVDAALTSTEHHSPTTLTGQHRITRRGL